MFIRLRGPRCSDAQVQCDERLPRCTRCTDLDQVCQYPNDDCGSEQKPSPGSRARRGGAAPPDDHHANSAGVSPTSGTASRELSSTPGPPSAALAPDGHQHRIISLSAHILDARDLELLSHYLTHTSRTIALDRDDLYVLHVGIPNLAFSSRALMSSMLALAAASQCHDLLEAGPDVARIRELLVLAEQHHAASLRQIQEDIPSTERYDHVLANAALMVLYGSASHWVRIRLMRACRREPGGGGNRLPGEFVPVRSHWMSLIRAVHSAYVGLLADQAQNPAAAVLGDSEGTSPPRIELGNVDVVRPQDGPSDETRRLFLPILAATSGAALTRLRARARQAEVDAAIGNEGLGVCMEALAVFQTVLGETFRDRRHGGLSPETPGSQTDDPRGPLHPPSLGRLSNVAPWLRRYTARVTMNSTDSRPLRRTVNAFINRVPTKYLHMVQATLEHIPVDVEATGRGAVQGSTPRDQDADGSPVQRLAMDIFAHWLVLLLLLDGVWWIGGTGAWELGGVVAYARERGWVDEGDKGEGGAWWPESMYNIRMELSRNLAR